MKGSIAVSLLALVVFLSSSWAIDEARQVQPGVSNKPPVCLNILRNVNEGELRSQFNRLQDELNRQIVGQSDLVKSLVLALITNGHILVEGPPGVGKSKAITQLSSLVSGTFQRIQFTSDMAPSDITGYDQFDLDQRSYRFKPGPIFANLIMADEINRATAKTQSALLEAMAENQVTVDGQTYNLEEVFLVMATQNPLEQQGTFALPEAQMDRFLMQVKVELPDRDAEREILALGRAEQDLRVNGSSNNIDLDILSVLQARQFVAQVQSTVEMDDLILNIVMVTRRASSESSELLSFLVDGLSPRTTLAIDRSARANAWLNGRSEVTIEDIRQVAANVLRHRLQLNPQARAEGITADTLIEKILRAAGL